MTIPHESLQKLIPTSSKLVSNLPYNISIKLIINWIKMNGRFNYLILMIQKEVAEKMNYGKLMYWHHGN